MKVALLSDVHGNKNAFMQVKKYVENEKDIEACILLGDIIDYGPHSNEVIMELQNFSIPILCNIWGNHEAAILREEYDRFSSDRGRESAKYTLSSLTEISKSYLKSNMNSLGKDVFEIGSKRCLAVHGSLEDYFWKSIFPSQVLEEYAEYDYVFSGHSHEPHFFEKYYKIDNPDTRNRKKTIFINPGSVGQPRNLNNMAQFAVLDTESEEVCLKKIEYDYMAEIKDFSEKVDEFYKKRLVKGV